MLRVGINAEFPELNIEIIHEGLYAGLDCAEVVVLHLLTLGRFRTEERAARKFQVITFIVKITVNEKVLLLAAYICDYARRTRGVTEQIDYLH